MDADKTDENRKRKREQEESDAALAAQIAQSERILHVKVWEMAHFSQILLARLTLISVISLERNIRF